MSDLFLRHKWTFQAHGRQVVFVKRRVESTEHVVMKALLWALYLPTYPDLVVEIPVGDRFKPDVVALDEWGRPRFWGEAGEVQKTKIHSLARRYRTTHLAIGKWDARLDLVADLVREALRGLKREAPFDLLCFPSDSAERFINEHGEIYVTHDQIEWLRLEP